MGKKSFFFQISAKTKYLKTSKVQVIFSENKKKSILLIYLCENNCFDIEELQKKVMIFQKKWVDNIKPSKVARLTYDRQKINILRHKNYFESQLNF